NRRYDDRRDDRHDLPNKFQSENDDKKDPDLSAIIKARYRSDQGFDGRRMRQVIQRKAFDYITAINEYSTCSKRIVGKGEGLVPEQETYQIVYDQLLKKNENQLVNKPLKLPHENISNQNFIKNNKKLKNKNIFHNMLHHTSINKLRSPINTLSYTPDGRRLITGNANGEFTLWNTFTHSFETIMQAHDSPIRKLIFSNDKNLILSADNNGTFKIWYLSMNNVLSKNLSNTAIRDITCTQNMVITCGDDAIIQVHDYEKLSQSSLNLEQSSSNLEQSS
ncbi:Polyadenylation factor I complex, subunit PFS2, partial [Pseudoloma neurophilia]